MSEYIYLLQEREFKKSGEKVYKIGRTSKDNLTRFNQYPKGSELIIQVKCMNSREMEKRLIKKFDEKYIKRRDIGNEYYEGEYKKMMKDIYINIEDEDITDIIEYIDKNNKRECAKVVFKKWCDNKISKSSDWKVFNTNFVYNDGSEVSIGWRSNRSQDAWLNYPIAFVPISEIYYNAVDEEDLEEHIKSLEGDDRLISSVETNWDEIWGHWDDYVPTIEECLKKNIYPEEIIDIVLPHKGRPAYFIEIYDGIPVSENKIDKLKKLGVRDLIEIDAEWILEQKEIPTTLKIRRWLIK